MMKNTFCVMVLGVSLVGCVSSERDLPETCRVIEEVKPVDADKVVIDTTMEVQVRFVKVEQKTLDVVGAELLPGKGAGHRYDLSDFDAVPAEKLERCLAARRDLLGNDATKVLARNGKEGEVKSVTECLYPQDFDVMIGEMKSCGSNANAQVRTFGVVAAEPQNFTMREVGMIVRATPRLMDDGKHAEVMLRAEVVGTSDWLEYGSRLPAPDGSDYELTMKQPVFPSRLIESRYKVVLGETQLIGARVGAAGSDVTELVFLRVRKTGACSSSAKQQQ